MQTLPQISFDDIPPDPAVQDAALEHVRQLESLYGRITGCHVVVAQPHRHHREGRAYSVRIELVVPGADIVVNRDHHPERAHDDPLVALRDAFLAVRRRLEDHVRRARGAEKSHAVRARGRIARINPLANHGFIETPDGREVYFHRHAISDHDFRLADVGSEVVFAEEDGNDGPQASIVQLTRRSRGIRRGTASPGDEPT